MTSVPHTARDELININRRLLNSKISAEQNSVVFVLVNSRASRLHEGVWFSLFAEGRYGRSDRHCDLRQIPTVPDG